LEAKRADKKKNIRFQCRAHHIAPIQQGRTQGFFFTGENIYKTQIVEVMMKTGNKMQFCILGLAFLTLTACGTTRQPPLSQMALAQSAVERAASAGSSEYASLDLKTARTKIDRAKTAMQSEDKDYITAERLLEEAEVDAELAEAKSKTAKSQKIVAELKESITTLRDEIQRNRAQ
jgi:hypothetical protein